MDHLTRPRRSLNTLGVIIDLTLGRGASIDGGIGNDFQYTSLRQLAQSKHLINIMANVSVESKIRLLIRSNNRTGLQIFNGFAMEVAEQRHWSVSTTESVTASKNDKIVGRKIAQRNEASENEAGSDEVESPTSFQGDVTELTADRHNWIWTLQPRHC